MSDVGATFTPPKGLPAPTPEESVGYFAALVAETNEHVLANGAAAFSAKVEEHVREQGNAAFAARPDVQAFMRRNLARPMNLHGALLRRPVRREPRRVFTPQSVVAASSARRTAHPAENLTGPSCR